MGDSLWMKLRMVPWDEFPPNPGTDKKVSKILENLASRKEPRAMRASHELWAALCAGQVAPASVPSIPFLAEILGISNAAVQSEIFDILFLFSQVNTDATAPDWHSHLIFAIKRIRRTIEYYSRSKDPIVADKALQLLKAITP